MNKIIGILLVALSLLTSAIVISLGQISRSIKEAASGNFGFDSAFLEVPWIAYILIIAAACLGIYSLSIRKNK